VRPGLLFPAVTLMPLSETILIATALLTLAMLAAGLCRTLPIPYTVFLVVIGVILGSLAREWPRFRWLLEFQLTPELVLFLFLPALIFESAFNLDARQLVKDLAPVLALAVPAVLVSTLIIGAGLWASLHLSLLLALVFGALISATDPVAVIALFKELGAPQRLTVLVEGESLLNDATAIVLFNILLALAVSGSAAWSDIGTAATDFFRVFAGGLVVGTVMALVLTEILHRMRMGVSAHLVMSIVMAYAGFAVAEHVFHVSGVMSVLAGAVTLAALAVSRIPRSETLMVREAWETIALVCNSLLFLLVGLSVDIFSLARRLDVIAVAILVTLAARAATVYSMVPATVRLFRLPRVSAGERHIMWWGGLKGGLAIAIALSIPSEVAGRDLLLDLTVGVVLFSLLVNAPTIRPLIHGLGIDRLSRYEQAELKHALVHAEDNAARVLEKFQRGGLLPRGTQELIRRRCRQVFAGDSTGPDYRQDVRYLYLTALRAELEELKHLYDIGLIDQYIHLDMKNTLYRDREYYLSHPGSDISGKPGTRASLFVQMEGALIKLLREHDWAAGLLARYQYLRFSQSLQRDIAGVHVACAAMETVGRQREYDEAQRGQVMEIYRRRLSRRKERLRRMYGEFPEFCLRFETNLFARVALLSAQRRVEEAHQHGELGTKAFSDIERRIRKSLSELRTVAASATRLKPADLIDTVPLLNGLSPPVLEGLAQRATPVTFLAGDVVIGEGEKGDALYIISHGMVRVTKGDEVIAELRDGDFFGEMALLGEQVRTATITAVMPSTLLRLTRHDVLALAEADHELSRRLEQTMEARL